MYVAVAVLVMGGVPFNQGLAVLTWKLSTRGVRISSLVPGTPSGPRPAPTAVWLAQVTRVPSNVPPPLALPATYVVLAGMVSRIVTFVAVIVPVLVTMRV